MHSMKRRPRITLRGPSLVCGRRASSDPVVYSLEYDDVRSILAHVCDELARMEGVEFLVRSFHQAAWPVSVDVDLAVLLEQLPSAVTAVRQGGSFVIDFFAQGIERVLRFERQEDMYRVTCVSREAGWVPQWDVEWIVRSELRDMLSALSIEFLRLARARCPEDVCHPWFVDWSKAVS